MTVAGSLGSNLYIVYNRKTTPEHTSRGGGQHRFAPDPGCLLEARRERGEQGPVAASVPEARQG